MKKQVFKTFSILMITSLLIGCSNIGGGSSNVANNIEKDQIKVEREKILLKSGLKNPDRIEVKYETFVENPSFKGERQNPETNKKELITYKFDKGTTFYLNDGSHVKFEKGSHIQFKSDYPEISKLYGINNNGNMYFVDESEEPVYYTLNARLINSGEIFVMDGNQGSTLTINGRYDGSGTINLGLYKDKNNNLTTDKIHITGDTELADQKSNVNFIYNEEMFKKSGITNAPNPIKDDYVIKLDGKITKSKVGGHGPKDRFYMKEKNIPYGTEVYELKYHEKTKEVGSSHIWKLEKRK